MVVQATKMGEVSNEIVEEGCVVDLRQLLQVSQ